MSIVLTDSPATPAVWGMTPAERTRRQLAKIGKDDANGMYLRGDVVYDDAVLRGLLAASEIALAAEDGTPLAVRSADGPAAAAWLAGSGLALRAAHHAGGDRCQP